MRIIGKKKYNYRCRSRVEGKECGARKKLNKMIEFYKIRPRCPSCKRDTLVLDKYRERMGSNEGRETCCCDGYWWSIKGAPHRKGSYHCIYYTGVREDEYDGRPPLPDPRYL